MKIIFLTACAFIFADQVLAQANHQKTTIVFVCEHGGARSTIASVYFNKLAKDSDLSYESIFLGLKPDSTITKETERGLKADGFNTTQLKTAQFSGNKLTNGALLISLDCEIPETYHLYKVWKGIPPISENYDAARNEIKRLVSELINDLKSERKFKNQH